MSSSREESPDWLRSFQAPTRSIVALSSGSESPLDDDEPLTDDEDGIMLSRLFKRDPQGRNDKEAKESPVPETSEAKPPNKDKNAEHTPVRKRKREDHPEKEEKDDERVVKRKASVKPRPQEPNSAVLTLSSDSESFPDTTPVRKDITHQNLLCARDESQQLEEKEDMVTLIDKGGVSPHVQKSPKKQLKKDDSKSSRTKKKENIVSAKNDGEMDVGEEDIPEKQEGPQVSSSRLPLMISDKVQRSKALVECEGDSIDLSGDVGAVGRIVISDTPSGNDDMFLDLKGTIYKTAIVPSRTFCVVSFGQSEAKIEAIMNDVIQLKPPSNVYEAETMVEGTLEGFSFDSEEETGNIPKATGQNVNNEAAEEQSKGKTKGKSEKTRGAAGKKAKTAGGKSSKKVAKKTQVPKKSKAKK